MFGRSVKGRDCSLAMNQTKTNHLGGQVFTPPSTRIHASAGRAQLGTALSSKNRSKEHTPRIVGDLKDTLRMDSYQCCSNEWQRHHRQKASIAHTNHGKGGWPNRYSISLHPCTDLYWTKLALSNRCDPDVTTNPQDVLYLEG